MIASKIAYQYAKWAANNWQNPELKVKHENRPKLKVTLIGPQN